MTLVILSVWFGTNLWGVKSCNPLLFSIPLTIREQGVKEYVRSVATGSRRIKPISSENALRGHAEFMSLASLARQDSEAGH